VPNRCAGPPTASRVRGPFVGVVITVAVVLAGCGRTSVSQAEVGSATTSVPTTSVPTPTRRVSTTTTLPVTPVQWTACGDLQCGSVTVPLDYSDPGGPTVQIAVARHPAEDPSLRIGSLVINPGGPGSSGIDDLPNELSVLTPELLDRFDIVSFDPRGVERSSPVTCSARSTASPGSPSASGGAAIDPVPDTAAARRALLVNDQEFARQCEKYSDAILPYVGTVDTARDLDRIRQALGDARLTFMGNSYGTLLGATYAELFPTHVRAMVLDSAIDPALSTTAYATGQADSLESELTAFSVWCTADADCPWRPTGDPTTALTNLIRTTRTRPLPVTGGGTAGPSQLYGALLAGLESQSSWPTLAAALAGAESGNGSALAAMTSGYRRGGSTNGADAEQAIDCLDHPVDRNPASYPALADRLARSAPVFGPLLAWALLGCAVWPVLPTRRPAPASDPGSPPILVVGTTGDPVTPYVWSADLAKELADGVLLTWQGRSHVAYFYSQCVRDVVQRYLVGETPPPPGTTCTG
jgi:pimeloyl-ACP methyl ester carboxylesterase